jgi:hypothetical protein
VNERADSEESNQSKKAEIVNYNYRWQRGTSRFVKTPKGTEEKATFKGAAGMACFRGSAR